MKVHVMWYGGAGYDNHYDESYLEEFSSVMSASIQLYNRVHISDVRLPFSFINIDPGYLYLGSSSDCYMDLYKPGSDKPFARLALDENGKPVYKTIKD
jgi:hypothetical protein